MALLGGIARGLAAGYVGHTQGKLEAGERRRQRAKERRDETHRQEDREDRRRAREAEAHLDAIRLSTEQIRARAAADRTKDESGDWQIVETPNGYYRINRVTGQKQPVGISGKPTSAASISDDDRREARAQELVRGGMDPEEAYRQANARYPRHQGLTAEQMLEVLARLSAGRTGAGAPPPPRR